VLIPTPVAPLIALKEKKMISGAHSQKATIERSAYEWLCRKLLISCLVLGLSDHVHADPQSNNWYTGKPVCHESDKFIVIVHDSNDLIGNEIIVRQNTAPEEKNRCNSYLRPDDIRVAKFDEAKYFLALYKDILILDKGTGPDRRELSIISMSTGRDVWKAVYEEDPKIKGTNIQLLKFIRIGNRKICSNYQSIVKKDFTPMYVIPIEFSLTSLKEKVIGPGFCVQGQ